MIYKETYRDLCHGTDIESAEKIKEDGFELRGDDTSWCGKGVYFYDIKNKAWWAAARHCDNIRNETGKKIKPTVLFADVVDINKSRVFDLRVYKDLCSFESYINDVFGEYVFELDDNISAEEKQIVMRAIMIDFYSKKNNKQLVVGCFRQRSQPIYNHAIEFANRLELVFGVEIIYCVKDTSIISNIRQGGVKE
ncbi:MAG: hypothetical protein Q4C46_11285 [Bacillota bacterium]|nr:hypothetical protein [Bacillota bacterium]